METNQRALGPAAQRATLGFSTMTRAKTKHQRLKADGRSWHTAALMAGSESHDTTL